MSTKLTIYGTVFNSVKSIRPSVSALQNVFSDVDGGFELVIVDNYSNDGTFEVLKQMSETYSNIYVYRKKSNRGMGRQMALEKASGHYVYYVDFDDVILDSTMRILLTKHEDYLEKNVIIDGMCRKEVIEEVGGWKPLNASEDVELSARAISKGYELFSIPAIKFLPYDKIVGKTRGKAVVNESRYVRGVIALNIRRLKWAEDFCAGSCIRVSDLKYFHGYEKLGILLANTLNSLKGRKAFCVDPSVSNIEFVELHRNFLDPGEFNIPEERWFESITRRISDSAIKKRIDYFLSRGYKYVVWLPDRVLMSPLESTVKSMLVPDTSYQIGYMGYQ